MYQRDRSLTLPAHTSVQPSFRFRFCLKNPQIRGEPALCKKRPTAPTTQHPSNPEVVFELFRTNLTPPQRLRCRAVRPALDRTPSISARLAADDAVTQRGRRGSVAPLPRNTTTTRPTTHHSKLPQLCDHYSCCWQAQSLLCKAAHPYHNTCKQ